MSGSIFCANTLDELADLLGYTGGAKENFPRYELNADETIGHVTREGDELVSAALERRADNG